MKRLLTIILSVFLITAYAQDYKELIKNVPGADKYPNASSINVFTKVDINLNNDGSYTKHVFYIKKILNYKGKDRYSDVKIQYYANFESITLGECYTIKKGEKVPLPKEATHDNETYMTMYSPDYINQREAIINFPAIEPGDFVVVDYTLNSKTPPTFFSGVEHMQEDNPYLKKEFSITADKSTELSFWYDKNAIKFNKEEKDGKIIYKWQVENMPLIKDEKNRPTLLLIGKPVYYSIKKSWEEVANTLFANFEKNSYDTKDVAGLVKDYANTKISNEKKLEKIYNYIQNNFSFKYNVKQNGFYTQDIKTVLNQKYGSNFELSKLFIAMAKACHINLKPVIVVPYTELKNINETPNMNLVVGIAVLYEGKLVNFMQQYLPFGVSWFEEAKLLDKDGKLTNYKSPEDFKINKEINIELTADKNAKANFKTEYKGIEDFSLRRDFINETEKKRKIWFASDIKDKSVSITSGPEFENLKDFFKNVEVSFDANISNFYTKQNKYIYFKLPLEEKVSLNLSGLERETPYEIDDVISINETYTFKNIPKGFHVIKPKTNINLTYTVNNKQMYYKVNSNEKDGVLVIKRKVYIPKTIVELKDYKEFYTFISKIKKPLNTMVFLKNTDR